MVRRTQGQGRFSNRQKTWFWILLTTVVVIALLYWEQIALLYVMATISMTLLLLIVAGSDLSGAQTQAAATPIGQTPPNEGAAKLAQPVTQSSFASRGSKKRK